MKSSQIAARAVVEPICDLKAGRRVDHTEFYSRAAHQPGSVCEIITVRRKEFPHGFNGRIRALDKRGVEHVRRPSYCAAPSRQLQNTLVLTFLRSSFVRFDRYIG